MRLTRILLGSDGAALRGLSALLAPHYEIIGTVSDELALVDTALRLVPEIVIVDTASPRLSALDAARQIRSLNASIKLIFLKPDSRLTLDSSIDNTVFAGCDVEGYVTASRVQQELLPAIEAVRRGQTYVSPPAHIKQPRRIIIADDNEGMREILIRMLSGYDVVGVVKNGRRLVDVASKLKPDILIVDISMPEMNGFEAVRQIKLAGVNSKVVFFTTHASPAYVKKALSLGASGYVLKMRGFEELRGALQMVMSGRTFVSPSLGN